LFCLYLVADLWEFTPFPAKATTGNPGGNWVQYQPVSNRVDGVVVTLPPVIRHQSVYDADRDVLWLWHGEYATLCSRLK
jgi:hypothetical protein